MPKGKLSSKIPQSDLFPIQGTAVPDFYDMLRHPLVKEPPLPGDFDEEEEAEHLSKLWAQLPKLRVYDFEKFVHAGGSGMVFRVRREDLPIPLAMKIARKKLMTPHAPANAATTLSPVSESELKALDRLSHPNLVRLYGAIENAHNAGIVAICTTFVDSPLPVDVYLKETLEKTPTPKGAVRLPAFSPQRLDDACRFLIQRCQEIASALEHMHSMQIYHFDIKPANIMISKRTQSAMLTDMGSCIHADQLSKEKKVRVHFTWTYAHPELTDIINDPRGITGGGLRASALIDRSDRFASYDLYAFGKTVQESLATLVNEFGVRCHASYPFRYLHMIACLLLDGHNAPGRDEENERVLTHDGRRFVDDVALKYPPGIFKVHCIRSAAELVNRLGRFSREYSWNGLTPELDVSQPDVVNSGLQLVPFTKRVKRVFTHPAMSRLKLEGQLGWLKEIYPGATHNRWSHSLGVFASIVSMLNTLLSDPEVPTFRILCDPSDIWHGLMAAMIHDLGQSSFGHDLEEVSSIFSHDKFVRRLLEETYWGDTLSTAIQKNWGELDSQKQWKPVNVERILSILDRRQDSNNSRRAIDGVLSDCISGPIDADKLDYLLRDSIACGTPYGNGMDSRRLLRSLSVTSFSEHGDPRLSLAYKAKGRSAVESMLLARYQMFEAVYWHHAYRCVQAMFGHAANLTFGALESSTPKEMRGASLSGNDIQELFYQKVILGKSWRDTQEAFRKSTRRILPREFAEEFSLPISSERAIEFVYRFANDSTRGLLNQLLSRSFFKRVFEVRVGELGPRGDYSAIKNEFTAEKRLKYTSKIQENLLEQVDSTMREHGGRDTITENKARERLRELREANVPLVVIDFPTRGISADVNFPHEIGDSYRKYFAMPAQDRPEDDNVFVVVRKLHMQMAAFRVFAVDEFHELIIRYLSPGHIKRCIASVLPFLTQR